ncbi:oligosaccharide flippase family protein [Paeniglutamicibacter sp. Y32M11]|uniref:oligosaccharide flippase family protein n=1 Tax=Paeniglutamicibacter sp. Y32M11 TaxID=2853258 RepID=UPI001C527FF8|nr:oligosaccharide flippase family protein [Paeniglutamicibacter sp. Y32M11]QXQ09643.1 oligosaccharide flippase family protein [Paeniglutamicibacter sp. Y32M11]
MTKTRFYRKLKSRAKEIDLGSTASYKGISLAFGLIANLGAVAVLSNKFGVHEYAAYSLIASLIYLLPFADLGLGASVVNAVSDQRERTMSQRDLSLVLGRVRLLLSFVGFVLIIIAVLLTISGGWAIAFGSLGANDGISTAAMVTVASIGLALPLGLGSRILQGLGLVRETVRASLFAPIATVTLFLTFLMINAPAAFYLCVPAVGYFIVAVVTYVRAIKLLDIDRARIPDILLEKLSEKRSIAKSAVPFFIISIGLAFGLQSHRLLLAQLGTPTDVATYSLVAQFTGPILAILTVAAQNLWSRYRKSGMTDQSSYLRDISLFSLLGIFGSVILLVAIPMASKFLTAGNVLVPDLLLFGASMYIVIVAIHQPGAMLLNDHSGLRFQALLVVSVSSISFYLLFIYIPSFGASFTYLCSAIVMIFVQVIPTVLISLKRLRNAEQAFR